MTKQEFEELLGQNVKRPTDSEYAKIEKVYTFHPSISNVGGKQQIATLYSIGGMRLIADMLRTAKIAEDYDNQIRTARAGLQKLEEEFAKFARGEEV